LPNSQSGAQIKLGYEGTSSSNKAAWIAVSLGVVAALANMIFVSRVEGSKLEVLKAKTRLPAGRTVSSGDFTEITISGKDLGEMRKLVVESKDVGAFKDIPLIETLEQGQLLVQGSFGYSANRGIRDAIDDNHRALALMVKDESDSVAYMVRPGDVVDVWFNDGGGGMQLLIPEVQIRAVGDATVVAGAGGRDTKYRSVTVIVPKDSVQSILSKLGAAKSFVTLVLTGSKMP
jgi:hypothetical protein